MEKRADRRLLAKDRKQEGGRKQEVKVRVRVAIALLLGFSDLHQSVSMLG